MGEDGAGIVARSMWKGAISFGLITIPVRLYTATESEYAIRFNMLHASDLSRIQMKTWCPVDDAAISRSDTVKGYEYAPDQYVVITDDDLDKVPLKTVRAIEIEQFAPRDEATRRHAQFMKGAYYLEPDKIGRKAFALLKQVLAAKELTAICKVVIRDREALAALDPFEDTMLLTTLHWPDEIRSTKDLELGDDAVEFKPAELRMAEQLVEAMTEPFEPSRYRDEYRDALMSVIQAKIDGEEIVALAPAEESSNLVDLMKLLEASVKAATDARAATSPAPVSVAEAKAGRVARAAKPKAATPAPEPTLEVEPELLAARPVRRRKSA
jgi:DNA end-binding protein Ku